VTLTAWEAAARLFEPPPPPDEMTPLDILGRMVPRTVRTPALELINAKVVETINKVDGRGIIVAPPQIGKSWTTTRAGIQYALRRDPSCRVVGASYADRIARRFGRMVRNDIVSHQGRSGSWDCGLRLAPDQTAAIEWELTTGGGLYAVGVGGALTSRSADLLIIDDPLKGRKAADSPTIRDDVWEWWESTAASRLQPGASVILILTRWHYDDLAGRLMREQPGVWDLLHLPAQADPEVIDPDPLGRRPGEFLVSAQGWTPAQWEKRKKDAGDEWLPLHQGSPSAPGGEMFDVSKLRRWHWTRDRTAIVCDGRTWRLDPATRDLWTFITMDTAFSTKTSADWTVASCWGIAIDGSMLLLDVQRARVPAHQQIDVARPLVDRWQPVAVYAEASSRSTLLVRSAMQAGWKMRDLVADKDKVTRAAPFARRVEHGEVWFPSGPDGIEADGALLDYVRAELQQFPAGRFDDAVDTCAYAARVAFEDFVPPGDSAPPQERGAVDDLAPATDVPLGFDPMSADF
jgi:phage terminase large subunit-like protein